MIRRKLLARTPRSILRGLAILLIGTALWSCSAAPARESRRVDDSGASASRVRVQTASEEGRIDTAHLARQSTNPLSQLINVPTHFDLDQDVGSADGERVSMTVQPVVPYRIDPEWNLVSRTEVPLLYVDDVPAGEQGVGLGDIVQSLYFSPVRSAESGWAWGAGPALQMPTATDAVLGTEKWSVGPTGILVLQEGAWTLGILANHLWSVAGDDDRSDVNATYAEPFLAYTTSSAWTCALNAESTYDWDAEELGVPVNLTLEKVLDLGGRLMQFGVGVRYWAEETEAGPEGWGLRFDLTFLFPH